MTPARAMTTEEYFRTPETVLPEELIYGAVRVADAPTARHQAALRDIGFAILVHLKDHPVGEAWFSPVDVVLDRRRGLVVQPDFVFVSHRNRHIVEDRIWGAPDLVLEVLSPHPRIGEIDERLQWFAHYGVGECWLFHQNERRLEVLTFVEGAVAARHSFEQHDRIRSRILPAFDQSIATILKG